MTNITTQLTNSTGTKRRFKNLKVDKCKFPFKHKWKIYNNCVDEINNPKIKGKWCATKTNKNGTVIEWGYCPSLPKSKKTGFKGKNSVDKGKKSGDKGKKSGAKGKKSVAKGKKTKKKLIKKVKLIETTNLVPLLWFDNSCYMNSVLCSLFYNPSKYIIDIFFNNKISNKKLNKEYDSKICNKDETIDIKIRKQIRENLKLIYYRMNGLKGDKKAFKVEDFRSYLSQCIISSHEPYHDTRYRDAREFLNYLLRIFYSDHRLEKKINYVTNDITTKVDCIDDISSLRNGYIQTLEREENKSIVFPIEYMEVLKCDGTNYLSNYLTLIDDSGELEYIDGIRDDRIIYQGIPYKRSIRLSINNNTPAIFFSLQRNIVDGFQGFLKNKVIPDETIKFNEGELELKSIIIKSKTAPHYYCFFLYKNNWYYCDDFPKNRINKIGNYSKLINYNSNIVQTHGMVYLYF